MAWIVGGAVLGGALLGGRSSRKAANAAREGSEAAIEEQRRQYDLSRADLAPWREAGTSALAQMQDPSAFKTSPGYRFRLDQSIQALDRSAAARGGVGGGTHKAAIVDYAGGMASGEYGNWYNRLAQMAGLGGSAATQTGQLGMNAASNIGGYQQNIGSARASGYLGQAQAIGQGIGSYAMYMGAKNAPSQPSQYGPYASGYRWGP